MKSFTVPTMEQVTPANHAIFDSLNKALGFVPNLSAAIAHSDNGLTRYLAYQNFGRCTIKKRVSNGKGREPDL
ncbi:MAG: hypothetical protein ABJA37_11940 [Ferruginibacter sp.]